MECYLKEYVKEIDEQISLNVTHHGGGFYTVEVTVPIGCSRVEVNDKISNMINKFGDGDYKKSDVSYFDRDYGLVDEKTVYEFDLYLTEFERRVLVNGK